MSGAYTAERVDAVLDEHGATAVLGRAAEGTTISLKAKRYGSSEEPLDGSAAQAAIKVKIGTRDIAASAWTAKYPKRKDSLVFDGRTRTVTDVDSRKDGDVYVMHILTVTG